MLAYPPEQVILLVDLDELEGRARPVALLLGQVVELVCHKTTLSARAPVAFGPARLLLLLLQLLPPASALLTETRRPELGLLAHGVWHVKIHREFVSSADSLQSRWRCNGISLE